jgi:hypothetical protein
MCITTETKEGQGKHVRPRMSKNMELELHLQLLPRACKCVSQTTTKRGHRNASVWSIFCVLVFCYIIIFILDTRSAVLAYPSSLG